MWVLTLSQKFPRSQFPDRVPRVANVFSFQVINPACTQSLAQPSDGLDNDCDAKIDEEFCDDMGTVYVQYYHYSNVLYK